VAGVRRVGLPRAVVLEMRKHLAEYVEAGPSSLVFTRPKGAPIRRGNARKLLRWNTSLATIGLTGVRFHDLRHTRNTLAARSGVSTRDLMSRMGHDSVRAAIIYQHATTEADARIADSLDANIAGAVADGGPAAGEDGGGVVLPFGQPWGRSGPFVAHRVIGRPSEDARPPGASSLTWAVGVERVKGIEPSWPAWKARSGTAAACTCGGRRRVGSESALLIGAAGSNLEINGQYSPGGLPYVRARRQASM